MKLVRVVIRADPLLFGSSAFFGLLSGIMGAGILYLINQVAADAGRADSLAWYFLAVLVLFLLSEIVSQYLIVHITQDSVLTLRNRIIATILAESYSSSEDRSSEIISALSEDVSAITQAAKGIPLLLTSGAMMLSVISYLCMISWELSLVMFLFLGLQAAVLSLMQGHAQSVLKVARKIQDRLFGNFQTISGSLKEFKLNTGLKNEFLREDYMRNAYDFRSANKQAFGLFLISGSVGRIFFFVLIGILLFVVRGVLPGRDEEIVSFVLAIIFLKAPIEWMLSWLPTLFRGNVALEALSKFGSTESRAELYTPEPQTLSVEHISLHNLVYTYPEDLVHDPFTVCPLNLDFGPGLHFIVGGNGSGKSTLGQLLSGLYLPDSGSLRINHSTDIDASNVESYRHCISAVFQNVSMMGRIRITSDEERFRIESLLELFDMWNKVRFVDGTFSLINELSLGQQKRLALISSLIYDRPVYIYDEWAADQDPRFRAVFYRSILMDLRRRGKIVIVISHDESYFSVADQVLRMEYGRKSNYNALDMSLGQILVARGIIEPDHLEEALFEQRTSRVGERLGETIVRRGFADAMTVRAALVTQLGIGQMFMELGFITEDQLNEALRIQKSSEPKVPLGEVLVGMGFVTDVEVETVLGMKISTRAH